MHKLIIATLILLFPIIVIAEGNWTEEKIASVTEAIQAAMPSWTTQQTRDLLEASKFSGANTQTILTDNGVTKLEVHGETILLNGKDITGNLGSKITNGPNSPIFGDINGSQIATGPNSRASSDSFDFSFALNVALSLSLAASLYFNRRQQALIKRLRAESSDNVEVTMLPESVKRAANN